MFDVILYDKGRNSVEQNAIVHDNSDWSLLRPQAPLLQSPYCKRGYFRWGKISQKCWQDVSHGGNFHDTSPISFIKAYGFYFRVGVIFAKKTRARKTRKLPPRENFHVYSMWLTNEYPRIYHVMH